MTRGYFKVKDPNREYPARNHPPQQTVEGWQWEIARRSERIMRAHRWPVDFGSLFFFDRDDRISVATAWKAAVIAARGGLGNIAVYGRPSLSGAWDGCREVGEWAVESEEAAA